MMCIFFLFLKFKAHFDNVHESYRHASYEIARQTFQQA